MKYFILFFALYSIVADAQIKSVSMIGENFIILNGGKIGDKKIIFSKAQGDWFSTEKDEHGALTFYAPFDNRELRLDIEWDGKNGPHIITNETRHSGRTGEFIVTLPDKEVYGDGLNAYPDGEEEIRVTVLKIDGSGVELKIFGNITSNKDHMKVSGMINLKKNSIAKTMTSASYKDCDNVIHDKLIGAQDRSPSECEIKFDLNVRKSFHAAFEPVIEHFLKNSWLLEKETPAKEIMEVGRSMEKRFYNMAFTNLGNYELDLLMDPSSQEALNWKKKYEELTEQFKTDALNPGNMDKLVNLENEMDGATDIKIHMSINSYSEKHVNFTPNHFLEKLANNTFAVYLKNAQAPGGGGKEYVHNTVWVYFGKWGSPKFQKEHDGSEFLILNPAMNNLSSHLSVQNIVLRIESNEIIARKILSLLNISKLQSLFE